MSVLTSLKHITKNLLGFDSLLVDLIRGNANSHYVRGTNNIYINLNDIEPDDKFLNATIHEITHWIEDIVRSDQAQDFLKIVPFLRELGMSQEDINVLRGNDRAKKHEIVGQIRVLVLVPKTGRVSFTHASSELTPFGFIYKLLTQMACRSLAA